METNHFDELFTRLSDDLAAKISANILAKSQAFKQTAERIPQPQSDRIFIDEVMNITGLKRSSIYQLTCSGKLPHKRQGKRLIFSRKEILNYIESKVYVKPDPRQEAAALLSAAAGKRI